MQTIESSLTILENRHVVRVLAGLVCVLLIVFGVQSVKKGLRSKESGFQNWQKLPAAKGTGNDLTVYLEMAEALVSGGDPTARNFYPPCTAMAFVPLLALPLPAAHAVWYLVNVGCLFGTAVLIGRHVGQRSTRSHARWVAAFVIALLMMVGVMQNHFLNGQINLLAVFGCVVFFHWYSAGKSGLAALALALAIPMKVCPALLLLFLVFRRSWRTLALTLAWSAALNLVALLLVGDGSMQVLTGLASRLMNSFAGRSAIVDKTMFFTLSGFFHWLGDQFGWLQAGRSYATLKLLGGAIVMTGLCLSEWRRTRTHAATESIASLVCYLLAMLLLVPVSETHHLAFAFPAFIVLTLRVWSLPAHRSLKGHLALLAALAVGLLVGRLDRNGPWYFFTVATLFVHFLSSASDDSACVETEARPLSMEQNAPQRAAA